MDRRILAILLLGICIALSITGGLLYFIPFNTAPALLYTIMGIITISFILFHIVNNKRVLGLYLTGEGLKMSRGIQISSIILAFTMLIIAILIYFIGFNSIYNWGNEIRNKQVNTLEETYDYQMISTSKNDANYLLELEVKKGSAFKQPLIAFWIADSTDSYIQTLYISQSMSNSEFRHVFNGKDWVRGIIRRPEALPIWAHQRNIKASDGLYIPLGATADLDGLSGATPTSNFTLKSSANLDSFNSFKIYMELNQSFDWNPYYSKDRFPNDSIYSGNGKAGQPSLLYSTTLTSNQIKNQKYFILQLIGHGHHSGGSGEVFLNLDNITTAANIVDRIILKIEKK